MRMPAAHLAATPCAILIAAVFSLASLPLRAAATPAVQWRELRVPRRTLHSMVWDSRRQRVLMFGGDGNEDAANPLPGVWQLVTGADPHWEPFTVAGDGPPPRSGMCAVYDSLRDRVLAFGGREAYGGPASNDLWQLSLAGEPAWSLLDASAGATPPPRWSATMVLDAQDRLVLYGGDGNAVYDPDVYLLPLGALPLAWQDLALAGPGPRARHGAVFSPITHRMTVFGGDLVTGFDAVPRPAETWELVLDDPIHWVKRASAPGDSVPLPETGGAFVADRAGDLAWLFPGDQDIASEVHDASVWQLDLVSSTWTRVQSGAGGPNTRSGMASTFVPSTGEVLVHGGYLTVSAVGLIGTSDGDLDTWRFKPGDPSPWSDAAPAPRNALTVAGGARMLFDEVTRTLFRHDARGVWTCDLGTDAAWRLDAAGTVNAPTAADPVDVIDPVRRRMLVFGGANVVASQLWSWPLDGPGAWTVTPIAGTPPNVVRGIQRAYDSLQDRVVVLSGATDSVSTLELGGGTPHWVRLATPGGPSPSRTEAAVAFDAVHDRVLLSGGVYAGSDYFPARDLWTLDLSGTPQWTVRIQGFDPGIWPNQGIMVDPVQDRVLLLGGFGQGLGNTIYGSPLATLSAWTNLDPDDLSPMWGQGVAFYDAAAQRALFWNGTLWEITWPGSSSAPPNAPQARGFMLASPRPNPARDHVTLVVETAWEGVVTLDLFDTAGRRVAATARSTATAGLARFDVPLPKGLAPGVYLVRARQDQRTAQARLAVTR
jgi:hypothetical protein